MLNLYKEGKYDFLLFFTISKNSDYEQWLLELGQCEEEEDEHEDEEEEDGQEEEEDGDEQHFFL